MFVFLDVHILPNPNSYSSLGSIPLLVILVLVLFTRTIPIAVPIQPLIHPLFPFLPLARSSRARLAPVHVGLLTVDHDTDVRGVLVLLALDGGGDTLGSSLARESLECDVTEEGDHLARSPLTGFGSVVGGGRRIGTESEDDIGRVVQVEDGRRERGGFTVSEKGVETVETSDGGSHWHEHKKSQACRSTLPLTVENEFHWEAHSARATHHQASFPFSPSCS